MNRLNRSSINMLASSAGYLVPILINFASTPLLLKALGEAAYGLNSLLGVIIGYLTFMDMGLDLPITKFLAEDRARADSHSESRLISNSLQLYAIIGLIGMVVIMLSAKWLAQDVFKVPEDLMEQAVWVFRLAGVGFLGSVFTSWGRAIGMGVQRFEITYGVSVVTNIVAVVIGLFLVYKGWGVVGYVAAKVTLSLLTGPLYWLVSMPLFPGVHLRWGLDPKTLSRLSSFLGYGTANRVIGSLIGRFDQTAVGAWVGIAAAGIYSIPFMIVSSFGYMIAFMLSFMFPMASELYALGQTEKLWDIYARSMRFVAALANITFVPLLVLGDIFLTLWVGIEISVQVTTVFRMLSLAFLLSTLTTASTNNVLIGIGRMRQFTTFAIIRGIVLVIACSIFIPAFGINGAGLALIGTEVVDVIYLLVVVRRYFQINILGFLKFAYVRPVLLGITMGLVAWLARPVATSWATLGALVVGLELSYIILGFGLNIFGETEKRLIYGVGRLLRLKLKQI